MKDQQSFSFKIIIAVFIVLINACNSTPKPVEAVMVEDPEKMDKQISRGIEQLMDYAVLKKGKLDDSYSLKLTTLVNDFYKDHSFNNVWSNNKHWKPLADSLIAFERKAVLYGLFPADYQYAKMRTVKKLIDSDSIQQMNAINWSKADLLFTDACLHILQHLKYGRLLKGNLSTVSDSNSNGKLLLQNFNAVLKSASLTASFTAVEPLHKGYWELKNGIKNFIDSMDHSRFTYVMYPFKRNNLDDSLLFVKQLQQRLNESKCIEMSNELPDSVQLSKALKKYQKKKGLKQSGVINKALINNINTNDVERFNRIAITLDRYKMLTDTMPEKYIWVNLPGYYLQVFDHDTVAFQSKIICGKPATKTPILQSNITDMVTYPTWTVPSSIIEKQYLPKLKSNPNYLTKIGLKLVDKNGDPVNPKKVNWSKFKKGIPYKVVQNSGDDNALGVIKFNFKNPYAVYLHDTNQRYLFKNKFRALSHGCVRVEEWEKLATFIAQNDSLNLVLGKTLSYNTDSINRWINAKMHKWIGVRNKVPLYITYFGCEGKNGKIKFYEDIYVEDKEMREKYFSVN